MANVCRHVVFTHTPTHTHTHTLHITVLMCLTAACKNPSNLSAGNRKRTPAKGQAKELTLVALSFSPSLSVSLCWLWVCVLMIFCTQLHNLTPSLALVLSASVPSSLWPSFCGWFMLICALHTALDYMYIYRCIQVDIKLYGLAAAVNAFWPSLSVCPSACMVIPLPGHVC